MRLGWLVMLMGLWIMPGARLEAQSPPPIQAEAPAPKASLEQRLVDFRRELHKNPELSNRETGTMRRIAAHLLELGFSDVRSGVAKTGVVALIKGGKPGPVVALRAPIDAFPVQEKREIPYRSHNSGVSHACGHDAMTAMVLGAAELLWAKREELAGDIRLIFQPAEEGAPPGEEGGAPLMLKEGVADRLSAIVTLHVDTDLPFGQAGVHPAAVYAGADTLEVLVQGASAHGATPWKGVDAIAVAGEIISGLQLVSSRQTDIASPVVLTLGTISAGNRSNAVAGEAKLTGTLRSYSAQSRGKARESAGRIVSNIAEAFGAKASLHFSEEIPPTLNDPGLVKKLRPALEESLGASNVKTLQPLPYADDFSVLAEKVPSFYFQLGVRNEREGITASTHTESFDLDERAIPLGAKLLAQLAESALK